MSIRENAPFLLICLILFVSLAAGCSETNHLKEDMTEPPNTSEKDYDYDIINEEAVIIDYIGDEQNVIIPATLEGYPVTGIENYAFSEYPSLTSVTIPESVSEIGENAFMYCWKLNRINVHEQNRYFTGVDGVLFNKDRTVLIYYPAGKDDEKYTIPESVTAIGYYAFYGCSNLKQIDVDEQNQFYRAINGVLFNKDATELIKSPAGKEDKEYSIPESVTSIGDYAFAGCQYMLNITMPDNITNMGEYAFANSMLESVTIPNSVTSLERGIFMRCNNLSSVTISDSVTIIGVGAFGWCPSLTNITIPDRVISIGNSAFSNCTSLEGVTIPNSVTSIGDYSFKNCASLVSITIPGSVTSIGEGAFGECSSLESAVFLGNAPDKLGLWAFDYCAPNFTIYYKEGAAGWSNLWKGYPAQLQ